MMMSDTLGKIDPAKRDPTYSNQGAGGKPKLVQGISDGTLQGSRLHQSRKYARGDLCLAVRLSSFSQSYLASESNGGPMLVAGANFTPGSIPLRSVDNN